MIYILTFLLIFIWPSHFVSSIEIASYPIGGLFNSYTYDKSMRVYSNFLNISTTVHGQPLDLKALEVTDSYSTALEVCDRTKNIETVIALIDARPTFGICDSTCILCNRLNITHLSLGWQVPELRSDEVFTLSYYPPGEVISKAFASLIKDLQWEKFTILYESDDSFIRIQEVINTWEGPEGILYRKLYPDKDNRETFKHIFKVAHMSYHILDCEVGNTIEYFKQIVDVNNSTQYQSFIVTSLEAYMLNIKDEVPALMANVSTFHMTLAKDGRWRDYSVNEEETITMETALTVDALSHLQTALLGLSTESQWKTNEILPPPLCFERSRADYDSKAYPLGNELRETLLMTKIKGLTGNIAFDKYGRRVNFTLYYSKLNSEGDFETTGHWNSITNTITTTSTFQDRSSARKSDSVLKVVSKLGEPYFMERNDNGTIKFYGYAVDLVDKIFKRILEKNGKEYRYEFYKSDGYGNPVEGTKKWNGLIGELLEHNAEMAICDLTITSERNSAVDFSVPFMTLGISMLYREPDPEPPDMFSFIQPLKLDVWLYLATTYIIVSFILFLCARMSQEDWVNPHPCNQNPENYQNIWSLYNCMWLTMGSIMTQGCDILPRAAGSRWTTGVWWFFAMIVTASYTANMSTFLSNSRKNTGISEVKDLLDQVKVSYGAVENASTYKFFKESNNEVYAKLWSVMSTAKPSVFTKSNNEGKDRVLRAKGKYAFFMESTAIEYFTHQNAFLKMRGGTLDSKHYGIAFPKRSSLKPEVDAAILQFQENGTLQELKTKWWQTENKKEEGFTDQSDSTSESNSLGMEATAGIFLVLGVGGIIGLIVAIIDFLLHANQIAVTEKVSFKEALATEWKTSLDPRSMHKPAAPQRSRPPSMKGQSRERSRSRAASVAASFINFDEIY